MAQARFYLLDDIGDEQLLPFVCEQIAHWYRQSQRVTVMAADQAQAEALDELLWQLPAAAFVPHNLPGEGPSGGSPVEIAWPQSASPARRPCLINLANDAPAIAAKSQFIIDIVPVESAARAQARERFKQYRQLGVALSTEPATLTMTK